METGNAARSASVYVGGSRDQKHLNTFKTEDILVLDVPLALWKGHRVEHANLAIMVTQMPVYAWDHYDNIKIGLLTAEKVNRNIRLCVAGLLFKIEEILQKLRKGNKLQVVISSI